MKSQSDNVHPIFLKIEPRFIAQLKFTVESYEGLGIVRTLDAERGEVVILAVPDTLDTVNELLAALKKELVFREVPAPKDLSGDWLMAEMGEE